MQQLVISIRPYLNQEMECKDFLAESNHSPEWIGDPQEWEIKNLYFFLDKQGSSVITALLENKNWQAPNVKAITGDELYAIIHNYPALPVAISQVRGLNNHISPIRYRFHTLSISDHNILKFSDFIGVRENIGSQLMEDVGYTFDNDTWQYDEDGERIAKLPLAIEFEGDPAIVCPVTGIQVQNDAIILLYNHDVNINTL